MYLTSGLLSRLVKPKRRRHSTARRRAATLAHVFAGTLTATIGATSSVSANDLRVPVPCSPCIGGADGATRFDFKTPGSATPMPGPGIDDLTGRRVDLLIDQKGQREIFNWASFDIGADAEVYFKQRVLDAEGNSTAQIDPTKTAINIIREGDVPSEILGVLRADGQVYLLNPNGVLFRPGARVDLNTLVVSGIPFNADADPLADDIFAFGRDPDIGALFDATDGAGEVIVEQGARIIARENGRIVLVGRSVVNDGVLRSSGPGGQILLVGGEDEVYLITDEPVGSNSVEDTPVRGLDVAVNEGGTATNNGVIEVGSGNVTLAGRIVNQNGIVRATTAVNNNGSIRLLARDGAAPDGPAEPDQTDAEYGVLTFGRGSTTEITVGENADQTATDAQNFPGAQIFGNAQQIIVAEDARIVAESGQIEFEAQSQPDARQAVTEADPEDVFIEVADGAVIDASGVDDVTLPVTANLLELEVRGNELANFPAQRNGPLNGAIVRFDVRKPLPRVADLSAAVNNRTRTLVERSLPGGSITLRAERGAVNIAEGALLDVSGGAITYEPGIVATSKVVFRGRIVDIHDADPSLPYTDVLDPLEFEHERWGITEEFRLFGSDFPLGTREPGYIEGKDAGSIVIEAAAVNAGGTFLAQTRAGLFQRSLAPFDALEIDPITGALTRRYLETGDTVSLNVDSLIDTSRRRQATVAGNVPGDQVGFQRPHDELPANGSLRLSSTLLDGSVSLESAGTANVVGSTETAGDRRRFSAIGFSDLAFEANDFRIGAGQNIALGPEGSLRVVARDDIDISGSVTSPGGDVVLVANPAIGENSLPASFAPQFQDADGRVSIGADARIDLAGSFVFDDPTEPGIPAPTPLGIDGGAFIVSNVGGGDPGVPAGVFVESGALVDVGGGAHSDRAGTVTAGAGGLVSIENRTFQPEQFDTPRADFGALAPVATRLDGRFRGFTVTGPEVLRTQRTSSFAATLPQIALGRATGTPGSVFIDESFLETSGFHNFKLVSEESVLELATDVDVDLDPQQYFVGLDARGVFGLTAPAPVSTIAEVARLASVDPSYAAPTNLFLDSVQTAFTNTEEVDANPAEGILPEAPNVPLVLTRAGRIEVNPGGVIRIGNEGALTIAGSLTARGGTIALSALLPRDNEPTSTSPYGLNSRRYPYVPDHALVLATGSRLDASGFVAEESLDVGDRPIGRARIRRFLDAGEIDLYSDAGYVVASPEASIDISGGIGSVLTSEAGVFAFLGSRGRTRGDVATDAGVIDLTTGLGGAFYATVDASADAALGAHGGRLSVRLDGSLRPDTARAGTAINFGYFTLPNGDSVGVSGTGESVEQLRIVVDSAGVPALAFAPAGSDFTGLFNTVRVGFGGFIAGGGEDIALTARSRPLASNLPDLENVNVVSPVGVANRVLGEAAIAFEGDVDLAVPGSFVIDAPVVQSEGGNARVTAGFARVGSSLAGYVPTDVAFDPATEPAIKTYAPVGGTGNLTIRADAAELVGLTSLHGFGADSSFTLQSGSDLKLVGVRTFKGTASSVSGTNSNSRTPEVQLSGLGDIVLAGTRIYPSTLTRVSLNPEIAGLGLETGTVAFTTPETAARLGNGALDASDVARLATGTPGRPTGSAPLSIGGAIDVRGDRIFQTTSVFAPLGDVRFAASDRVTLAPGSLTSVSAAGLSTPFGRTELGEWVVPFLDRTVTTDANRTTVVYRVEPDPEDVFEQTFPTKSIEFSVADADGEIELSSGARLDVRGGGNVFATEFTSGPSGTVDLLEPTESGGAFAVLPAASLPIGVTDPLDTPAFGYDEPAYVTLDDTAVPGLPAGRYVILPPRYALIEGAYLLTPRTASSFVPDSAAAPFTDNAGFAIAFGQISGYGQPGDSDFRQTFSVETPAQFRQRAEYVLTDANAFLADQARNENLAVPTLPRDAGGIVFDATAALTLGGSVVSGQVGGRGSRIDILADDIAIGTAPRPDTLLLDPGLLRTLGADSLLLGARRTVAGGSTVIDEVSATRVVVDSGVDLTLPEMLLSARDEVIVADGARVASTEATGLAQGAVRIEADAALVGVSSNRYASVNRTSNGDSAVTLIGRIDVSGTFVADAGGTLDFDAPGTRFAGQASAFFGAESLVVGNAGPGQSGVALGEVVREDGLETLSLRSGRSILFEEVPAVTPGTLVVDAPGIVRGGSLADLTLNLSRLTLRNFSGVEQATSPLTDMGTLTITADRIDLAGTVRDGIDSGFGIDGFEVVDLSADRIEANSDHTLTFANGATDGRTNLRTDLVLARDGAELQVGAEGLLFTRRLDVDPADGASLFAIDGADRVASAGGRLDFSADALDFGTRAVAAGGTIALTARSGTLTLSDGTQLAAEGLPNIDFEGFEVGSAGGTITLASDSGDVVLGGSSNATGLDSTRILVDVSGGAAADAPGSGGELRIDAARGDVVAGSTSGLAFRGASTGAEGAVFDARLGGLAGLDTSALLSLVGQGAQRTGEDFLGRVALSIVGGPGATPTSLTVAAGDVIEARRVRLVAENSSVSVAGSLLANGERAGVIELIGSDGVVLADTARLDARASGGLTRMVDGRRQTGQFDAGHAGGIVELKSTDGTVEVAAGAVVNVAGTSVAADGTLTSADTGRIRLVMSRNGTDTVDASGVNGTFAGASTFEVLGYTSYDAVDFAAAVADVDVNATLSDVLQAADNIVIGADLLISAAEDFALDAGRLAQLSGLFDNANAAGRLTVRAGGDLSVLGDLVDGRIAASNVAPATDREVEDPSAISDVARSWSLGLFAGADTASPDNNALGVTPRALEIEGTVSTGTGDITLASSGSIEFGEDARVVSTGLHADDDGTADIEYLGTFGEVTDGLTLAARLGGVSLPESGGRIDIRAAGRIDFPDLPENLAGLGYRDFLALTGADSDLEYRVGGRNEDPLADLPRSWGFVLENIPAGTVASLAGGDVSMTSGDTIRGASVVVSAAGRQIGEISGLRDIRDSGVSTTGIESDIVSLLAPGSFTIRTRNLRDADLVTAYGAGAVIAAGNIEASPAAEATPNATRLFVGQAQLTLEAAGALELGAIADPTTVDAGALITPYLADASPDLATSPVLATFLSSGEVTEIRAVAANGPLTFRATVGSEASLSFTDRTGAVSSLRNVFDYFLPANFAGVSLLDDVLVGETTMGIQPSGTSAFTIGAGQSIRFTGIGTGLGAIRQFEAIPENLVTSRFDARAPFEFVGNIRGADVFRRTETGPVNPVPSLGIAALNPPSTPNHEGDLNPVRLVARSGDIERIRLDLAEAARISAGRDVRNLTLNASNVNALDVTSVGAGRDIVQSTVRNPVVNAGAINEGVNDAGFLVNGGGEFVVAAGRDIDLGTSLGVRSIGGREDRRLEVLDAAAVTVVAGLSDEPGFTEFLNAFTTEQGLRERLATTLAGGSSAFDTEAALSDLVATGVESFVGPFETELANYIDELEAAGILAPSVAPAIERFATLDTDRQLAFTARLAFDVTETGGREGQLVFANAAMDSLFPAEPGTSGNLTTPLSTIQTQDGGDINVLVPYGSANTGLTALAGLSDDFRADRDLGVIAFQQGDVQAYVSQDYEVNSTRLFAQSGGNVLVFARDGDIDAGRGAKSVADIAQPEPEYDRFGNFSDRQPLEVAGSGIRTFAGPDVEPGDVLLFAPQGTINAGDAGIGSAGGLVAVANEIIGGDNISSAGPTTITTSSQAVSVDVGASDVGAAATRAATQAAEQAAERVASASQTANQAAPKLAEIDVDVLSFGE